MDVSGPERPTRLRMPLAENRACHRGADCLLLLWCNEIAIAASPLSNIKSAPRMTPGSQLGLTYEDFPRMYEDPETYVGRFTIAAREAIDRGAAALMVAGNPLNMFLIDRGVRKVDGVPILDCCTAAVKSAEMMADLHRLGIRRSAKGLFEAPAGDAREEVRNLFK